ncbi:MAG: hypothetical protein SPG07_00515 [Coriobacteriales bacterium]|nr:hypothetical protein [Coriobacteriales bacterium]
MDGEQNGTQAQQQDTQLQEQQQQAAEQPQQEAQQAAQGAVKPAGDPSGAAGAGEGAGSEAYEAQLAERDKRIEELEAQIADAAKAARVLLDEHGGDIEALKAAEPWLFQDAGQKQQAGKTGLPNAGTATDSGKQLKHFMEIAGVDDSE